MRHNVRAVIFTAGLLLPVPAFAAAVQYKGPVTLDNGATQVTTIDVTSSTPLPVTVSGGGSNAAASATGSAVPSSGGYNAVNVGGTLRGQTGSNPTGTTYSAHTDVTSVGGVTTSTGAGAVGTGSQRVAVGQDTTTVSGAAPLTTGIYVTGPSAAALATSALQTTGNASLATIATNSGSSIPAGTNVIGKVSIDQTTLGTTNAVQPIAGTTGGLTPYTLTAAASTNATNVKASAGTLYHISVFTNSATAAWLSFYNTAGTPTCGTSIIYQTMIPGNASGAGAVEDIALGMAFGTGIGICVTTGIAGTGSVAATSYVIGLGYK